MKRYIEIVIGGKSYQFLIDTELDKELESLLKDKYRFNSNDTLIVDNEDLNNSYNLKQLILKSIINQINTYDLTPDLQRKIDSLKDYIGSRETVYNSDLTRLNSILGEASEIYSSVRTNLPKKEVAKEKREKIQDSLNEIKNITEKADYENTNVSDTTSSTNEKIEDLKAIIEEISFDEEFKDKVPVNDINDAIDRVVICSSMADFIEKTGSNLTSYDVINAIKNKSEKIVIPPNTKLETVVVEILKTCINDDSVMNKVITYVDRKALYKSKTDGAFESLRSSLKLSGLNARNLNYYGDQFFDAFEAICRESGINFETMFADYFNSYSANRRYNSPMDKFMRLFNTYNGGDDNTRALLEAMLVKKAIARNLISRKYNSNLKSEYQYLDVTNNGYIGFNENAFLRRTGGISEGSQGNSGIEGTINRENNAHINLNSNSYSDVNANNLNDKPNNNLANLDNVNVPTDMAMDTMLNTTMAAKRKNRVGALTTRDGVELRNTEMSSRSLTGLSGRRFTSNSAMNPALFSEEETLDNDAEQESLDSETDSDNAGLDNSDSNISEIDNDMDNDETSEEQNNQDSINNLVNTAGNAVGDTVKKGIKKTIIEFIKKNPWVWGVVGVLFLFLLLFLIIIASNKENNKMVGLGGYEYLELSNSCSEVYVYDTPNGEDGTYPLEEYVAGVVAHEIGAFNNETMFEVAAITARTYALRRMQGSDTCSIPGNSTAQVFGKTDNEKIIAAANNTRGLVLARGGSLISTEYDAFCWDTKDDNYYYVCQKNYDTGDALKVPVEWANQYVRSISGQPFLDNSRYHSHGRGMSQQGAYYLAMEQEYTSKQILAFFYGSDAKLMSIYKSSYTGEFPLQPNDDLYKDLDFLIDKSMETLLAENGETIEGFNEYIKNIAETSGLGTREAVVNVAVSLIGSMAKMGYKLNYQWGGKYDAKGVRSTWGLPTDVNSVCNSYANLYSNKAYCTNTYRWASFDCSGFVRWSLINGFGFSNGYADLSTSGLAKAIGSKSTIPRVVPLEKDRAVCAPGDVLIKSGSHIVLIVGTDDDKKSYIVAESTGSNLNSGSGGVKLSYYPYKYSDYFCSDLSLFYNNSSQVEEE